MAYRNKEEDHQKRRDQEGSYSLYNFMYHWLLDNCEPQMDLEPFRHLLATEGRAYSMQGGKKVSDDELRESMDEAIAAFKENNGEHGDTAENFGKKHDGQFENVKMSLADLKW